MSEYLSDISLWIIIHVFSSSSNNKLPESIVTLFLDAHGRRWGTDLRPDVYYTNAIHQILGHEVETTSHDSCIISLRSHALPSTVS